MSLPLLPAHLPGLQLGDDLILESLVEAPDLVGEHGARCHYHRVQTRVRRLRLLRSETV